MYTSPSFPIGNKVTSCFQKHQSIDLSKTRRLAWKTFSEEVSDFEHMLLRKAAQLKARFGLQLLCWPPLSAPAGSSDRRNAVYILTGPEDAIVLNEEEVREGEMFLSCFQRPEL